MEQCSNLVDFLYSRIVLIKQGKPIMDNIWIGQLSVSAAFSGLLWIHPCRQVPWPDELYWENQEGGQETLGPTFDHGVHPQGDPAQGREDREVAWQLLGPIHPRTRGLRWPAPSKRDKFQSLSGKPVCPDFWMYNFDGAHCRWGLSWGKMGQKSIKYSMGNGLCKTKIKRTNTVIVVPKCQAAITLCFVRSGYTQFGL